MTHGPDDVAPQLRLIVGDDAPDETPLEKLFDDLQRALEDKKLVSYALSDAAERAYMRMVDHPTLHCEIRADGVMVNQPASVGFVRVAPDPPHRGELGFGLGARSVISRDTSDDIADAFWSLRLPTAPAPVRERAAARRA